MEKRNKSKKEQKKEQKKKTKEWEQEFYDAIKDLMEHPVVLQMKHYPHHCQTDCYQHCLNVAYHNYIICRKFGLDARSAARAGMLHDLFLYNWRGYAKRTNDHFHAMTHPRKALTNAMKHFALNSLEQEIIQKHMWPLTLIPPVSWEAFIITITDKYCGFCEIADFYCKSRIPGWRRLPFGNIHVR